MNRIPCVDCISFPMCISRYVLSTTAITITNNGIYSLFFAYPSVLQLRCDTIRKFLDDDAPNKSALIGVTEYYDSHLSKPRKRLAFRHD